MIRHGVDGWTLEDMDWDPNTGLSTFLYSKKGLPERKQVIPQPALPDHVNWSVLFNVQRRTFTM